MNTQEILGELLCLTAEIRFLEGILPEIQEFIYE